MFDDKKLDIVFKYTGVDAEYNGIKGKVIIDAQSSFERFSSDYLALDNMQAMMKSSQWPGIDANDTFTVGANVYKVKSVKFVDDGLLKLLEVK